mgnify:CR=1 FL=1
MVSDFTVIGSLACSFAVIQFRLLVLLFYRVVVYKGPLQVLCDPVRDAVDWYNALTTRRFRKGTNHSPF